MTALCDTARMRGARIGKWADGPYRHVMSDPGPNPLIRLFLGCAAVGFAMSALFVAILWHWDVMGLARHAQHSPDAFLLLFILWFHIGLLFGCVQIGYAVWQKGREDG